MSDLWFPGTDRSRPARVDGGSILGGNPKCLWHDTETSGLPSYSTDYWPNMTMDPRTGRTWQHIGADRACRALRNESGGVQTNRWNVFQIEVIGWVNKIPFHPVMAEVAQWLHDVRGTPLECTVEWLTYPASYGDSRVRMSGARWSGYSGHLGHQHAPENSHGDPGSPFPIDQILAGTPEEDDMPTEAEVRRAMVGALADQRDEYAKAIANEVATSLKPVLQKLSGSPHVFIRKPNDSTIYVLTPAGPIHVPSPTVFGILSGDEGITETAIEVAADDPIWG